MPRKSASTKALARFTVSAQSTLSTVLPTHTLIVEEKGVYECRLVENDEWTAWSADNKKSWQNTYVVFSDNFKITNNGGWGLFTLRHHQGKDHSSRKAAVVASKPVQFKTIAPNAVVVFSLMIGARDDKAGGLTFEIFKK